MYTCLQKGEEVIRSKVKVAKMASTQEASRSAVDKDLAGLNLDKQSEKPAETKILSEKDLKAAKKAERVRCPALLRSLQAKK